MPLHSVPNLPELPEKPEFLLSGEFDPDLLTKLCKGFLLSAREASLAGETAQYKAVNAIHLLGELSLIGEGSLGTYGEQVEVEFTPTDLVGVEQTHRLTIDREGVYSEGLIRTGLTLRGQGRLILGEQLFTDLPSRISVIQEGSMPTFTWRNNHRPPVVEPSLEA